MFCAHYIRLGDFNESGYVPSIRSDHTMLPSEKHCLSLSLICYEFWIGAVLLSFFVELILFSIFILFFQTLPLDAISAGCVAILIGLVAADLWQNNSAIVDSIVAFVKSMLQMFGWGCLSGLGLALCWCWNLGWMSWCLFLVMACITYAAMVGGSLAGKCAFFVGGAFAFWAVGFEHRWWQSDKTMAPRATGDKKKKKKKTNGTQRDKKQARAVTVKKARATKNSVRDKVPHEKEERQEGIKNKPFMKQTTDAVEKTLTRVISKDEEDDTTEAPRALKKERQTTELLGKSSIPKNSADDDDTVVAPLDEKASSVEEDGEDGNESVAVAPQVAPTTPVRIGGFVSPDGKSQSKRLAGQSPDHYNAWF